MISVGWAGAGEIGVQIECPRCLAGAKRVELRYGRMAHKLPEVPGSEYLGLVKLKTEGQATYFDADGWLICVDYDSECRHVGEPMGFFRFAWWPVRCRNGKRRWLEWVECHCDGTYTLGDRAH